METEPLKYDSRMAKTSQWLQAIQSYMRKVRLNKSTDVRAFLGLSGYYCRFLLNYPLTQDWSYCMMREQYTWHKGLTSEIAWKSSMSTHIIRFYLLTLQRMAIQSKNWCSKRPPLTIPLHSAAVEEGVQSSTQKHPPNRPLALLLKVQGGYMELKRHNLAQCGLHYKICFTGCCGHHKTIQTKSRSIDIKR